MLQVAWAASTWQTVELGRVQTVQEKIGQYTENRAADQAGEGNQICSGRGRVQAYSSMSVKKGWHPLT